MYAPLSATPNDTYHGHNKCNYEYEHPPPMTPPTIGPTWFFSWDGVSRVVVESEVPVGLNVADDSGEPSSCKDAVGKMKQIAVNYGLPAACEPDKG